MHADLQPRQYILAIKAGISDAPDATARNNHVFGNFEHTRPCSITNIEQVKCPLVINRSSRRIMLRCLSNTHTFIKLQNLYMRPQFRPLEAGTDCAPAVWAPHNREICRTSPPKNDDLSRKRHVGTPSSLFMAMYTSLKGQSTASTLFHIASLHRNTEASCNRFAIMDMPLMLQQNYFPTRPNFEWRMCLCSTMQQNASYASSRSRKLTNPMPRAIF
mmetsp:Transcript_5164/g.15678  ORF Transcript_5164/g.15678 Transcript_5164/m.15678 type:complete len:217 (-) Transcript_5164:2204-2854(-)